MFATGVALLASCSAAQDWNHEYWDNVLGYEEVNDLTSSGSLTFPGLGRSSYASDGTYSFTDDRNSVTRFGVFELRKDGRLCVEFYRTRKGQCSTFLRRNGLVLLLTEEGEKFPVFLGIQGE